MFCIQKFIAIAALLGSASIATGVIAQSSDDQTGSDVPVQPTCDFMGANGMVSMLLCPETLDPEDYAAEGRIACEGRAPCGAWIWTDAAAVPEKAPDAHDKLPKESVRQAVAIWVNDNEQLMMLKKETTN